MEQAQNEGSELALEEVPNAHAPSPLAGSGSFKQLEADEAQHAPPGRRKLSDEREQELTRLYTDTTMPVSEIARMLGIGESSVYRVAQRHGAALRVDRRHLARRRRGRLQAVLALSQELVRRRLWH